MEKPTQNFPLTVSRVSSFPLAAACDAANLFGRCARKGVASHSPAPPVLRVLIALPMMSCAALAGNQNERSLGGPSRVLGNDRKERGPVAPDKTPVSH